MTLARRLLVANPSMQVSDALSGSISLPSAKREVGDFELIARIVVNSSQTSVTFGGIPQNYKHLQLRATTRATSTAGGSTVSYGASGQMTFNGDTAANYTFHYIEGNGSTKSTNNAYNYNYILVSDLGGCWATSTAGMFAASIIDITDYTSTQKAKTIKVLNGQDRNGYGRCLFQGGAWFKTPEAITTISIGTDGTAYAAGSVFSLYGIRE